MITINKRLSNIFNVSFEKQLFEHLFYNAKIYERKLY
jgi:hypothetical protein